MPGCLDSQGPPFVPDGMTVETRHWASDVLEEGLWYLKQERDDPPGTYHLLIAGRATADERVDPDDETEGFVRETDFERSYVVLVQNMMQSARWLELRGITREESGLEVSVTTEEPEEPYGDDAVVHSFAIRITDERSGVPDDLTVRVDGEKTEASDGV